MQSTDTAAGGCADLKGFMQTRFFYGQRLDVRHFESEQNYVKGKLWLLNRLVHGYGVVCGLDVQMADDHQSVVIQPGIALDKAGREIVVPCPTSKYAIPPLDPKARRRYATRMNTPTAKTPVPATQEVL